jgi:hypothetical protein
MFLRLFSQWRIGPMGGFLGLEYAGVETLLRIERVRRRAEMFAKLQVMERAALPVLNEKYQPRSK